MGEYRHSVDVKGRVILPTKFRDELAGGMVITRGVNNCLWIFTKAEWVLKTKKLAEHDTSQPAARAFARAFLSGAAEITPDRQGRFVLPPQLRTWAHVDKDIVVTGLSDRIEIWNSTAWDEYLAEAEANFDENAGTMVGGIGL